MKRKKTRERERKEKGQREGLKKAGLGPLRPVDPKERAASRNVGLELMHEFVREGKKKEKQQQQVNNSLCWLHNKRYPPPDLIPCVHLPYLLTPCNSRCCYLAHCTHLDILFTSFTPHPLVTPSCVCLLFSLLLFCRPFNTYRPVDSSSSLRPLLFFALFGRFASIMAFFLPHSKDPAPGCLSSPGCASRLDKKRCRKRGKGGVVHG